jgi:hypothetical protein
MDWTVFREKQIVKSVIWDFSLVYPVEFHYNNKNVFKYKKYIISWHWLKFELKLHHDVLFYMLSIFSLFCQRNE